MLTELAERYRAAQDEVEKAGRKLGGEIVELLHPVIPDLELIWDVSDSIGFWSKSHSEDAVNRQIYIVNLHNILNDLFPIIYFNCLEDVWITREEADAIRKILEGAK